MTRIYEVNQKAAKLQIGDRVEVFRSCKNEENGWPNIWPDEMNSYIDRTLEIRDTGDHEGHGIRIGGYRFPYFCMKLHKVTIDDISR